MAETAELPRISVARFKDQPYPGGEPFAWRCNRCGYLTLGFHTEGGAYRDAAGHECTVVDTPDRTVCEQAAQFAEEVLLHGGHGEGWTQNDALLALRAGQAKGLHADDKARLREIAPDIAAQVRVLDDAEPYR